MLAEKILTVVKMPNWNCRLELEKMGIKSDNQIYKNYAKQFIDSENLDKDILISILCDNEIRENARKTTLKPTTKKRIKAIEKFLDKVKKNHNTKDRPVFHHFLEEENNIIYSNMHLLGIIDKAEVTGINDQYNLKNIEGTFPNYKQVIPELKNDHQTAIVNYSDVLAQHKANKANKRDVDYCIIDFDDRTMSAYNAEYLLHCFEVLGSDTLTLKRNHAIPHKDDDEQETGLYLDTTIITADNTTSYFVVCPCRLPKEAFTTYTVKTA
jgi:hypothetical protein